MYIDEIQMIIESAVLKYEKPAKEFLHVFMIYHTGYYNLQNRAIVYQMLLIFEVENIIFAKSSIFHR